VSSLGHGDCATVSIGAAGDLRDAVVAPVIVHAGSIETSERSIASSHSIRDSVRRRRLWPLHEAYQALCDALKEKFNYKDTDKVVPENPQSWN